MQSVLDDSTLTYFFTRWCGLDPLRRVESAEPAISIAQAGFLNFIAAFGYNQGLAKGTQSTRAQTSVLVGWVTGETWEQTKHRLG